MKYKRMIEDIQVKMRKMENYLSLKVEEQDWHGVADAAMDIRELVAQIKVLETLE